MHMTHDRIFDGERLAGDMVQLVLSVAVIYLTIAAAFLLLQRVVSVLFCWERASPTRES